MARPKRTAPWLATRENGNYYAFWYNETKKRTDRLSLATSDPAEAEIKFAEFLLNGKDLRKPRSKVITVSEALDDYLEEHVAKNCAAERRQRQIAVHLKAFFGDRPLEDVDVPLSQAYAEARATGMIGGGARRTNKVGSNGTIRRELNALVAASNDAIWMKRAPKGWAIHVDLPPEKRLGPDDEAPYYSREELDEIMAAADADEQLGLFVKLLYYTGARKNSIQELTRGQIRVPQKRIILQMPGKRTTKKRQPIVPILKVMEPPVKRLLEIGGKHRLFSVADFYRPYRELCEKVGIDETRRHPHIMRHTRATHLLQDGKSMYDVAKLLGDTFATIERVYGHHSHDHLASALED